MIGECGGFLDVARGEVSEKDTKALTGLMKAQIDTLRKQYSGKSVSEITEAKVKSVATHETTHGVNDA